MNLGHDKRSLTTLVSDLTQQSSDLIRKEAELALSKEEKEKTVLLESISELIAYQDLDNRIIWVNKAAGDSVGASPENLKGKKCHEIWYNNPVPCEI